MAKLMTAFISRSRSLSVIAKRIGVLLLVGCSLMANPSWSDPIRLNALQAVAESRQVSIHQAVQSVKSRYPGSKVLGAQTVQEQGQTIYIIKIVTAQGVIKHVRVNAGG